MLNKKRSIIIFIALFSLMFIKTAQAQQEVNQNDFPAVNYDGQPAVDTDMDGLTDEGEKQVYRTDHNKADTDEDGFSDGVEILSGTDPLRAGSYPGMKVTIDPATNIMQETPWAWYFSRAGGLVGFFLLYVSIFLGLTLRIPLLSKIISPVYSHSAHCWISLFALLFSLFHGVVLIFDEPVAFTLVDVLVPFASKYQTGFVALGIFSFYLMLILVVTSYGKRFMSQKLWRITHFSNIVLYIIGIVHAVNLGTDLKNPIVFDIFLWANAFLILIMLYNIEIRISEAVKRRAENNQI